MKMRNICIFVAVIIISTVLSACSEAQPESSAIDSFSDEPSIVFTDESSLEPTSGEESESPEEISEVLEEESIEAQLDEEYELFTVDSENTFALLDGKFIPINEAVEPVKFEKTELSEDEDDYDLTARYNLCGSSEQQIKIEVRPLGDNDLSSVTLLVDDIVVEVLSVVWHINAYIVDLDTNDNYVEIAFDFEGETDESGISFYRYDGSNVFSLGGVSGRGYIEGDMPSKNMVYIDRHGKVVSNIDRIMITSPYIASAYYQLSDNKLTRHTVDITPSFGKKHRVSDLLIPYWDDSGIPIAMTDESPIIDDMGNLKGDFTYIDYTFEAGEEIVLLSADCFGDNNCFNLNGEWYQIQLKDGRKGIIYYFAAG